MTQDNLKTQSPLTFVSPNSGNKPNGKLIQIDLPDPVLSDNAITILERRYLQKDSNGEIIETPKDMFWRVAKTIADNETQYDPECDPIEWAMKFYNLISKLDFVPNSPTLMNAGRSLGQLSACFVLPIEDSMEGIFDAVKYAALVHKSGGGTGFSFSRIRPKASIVASTAGTASGPVSFMKVFNAATETIKQGGTRRGANMGILRVDHPDIREFIECKRDMVSITNFNISVAATDAFMKAVEDGGKYDLYHPKTGEVMLQENAQDIFDLITENAWHNGDPGLVFIDEINRCHQTPHVGPIEATNPCGEQPLMPYESCNLGSLNLNNMLTEDREVDWDHLRSTIRLAVRFLDNIIDVNKYPIEQIREITTANRKIGLGLMGFADMLYAKNIPFDSEEALELAREVMRFINEEGRIMSDELAVERGAFPNCEGSTHNHPTRNSTVTTIAPTGTISMIADVSGGIEPNFSLVYVKRVMDDDRLLYVNSRFEEAARNGGFYSKELMEKVASKGHLANIDEIPEDVKRTFVTAHEISPEWHIKMQAAFQEHCENAVSKTINFPNSATLKDVSSAYMMSWKLKCKGVTIYRDGSRDVQVMNVGNSLAAAGSEEVEGNGTSREKMVALRHELMKPRHRPKITRGYTEQTMTSAGTMYVTINEDDQGLCEVFASIGKSGGSAAARSEAICRLISLALRSGVDPSQIVAQLKGITGSNPVWYEGELIRSMPDAIGKTLERYIHRRENQQGELPFTDEEVLPLMRKINNSNHAVGEQCPDCDRPLNYEQGCLVCHTPSCGYSKCE